MPRIGQCEKCDARFKIPDAVTASAAKCSKCGGTVRIPAADAASAAGAPTAPVTPAAPARPAASPPPAARKPDAPPAATTPPRSTPAPLASPKPKVAPPAAIPASSATSAATPAPKPAPTSTGTGNAAAPRTTPSPRRGPAQRSGSATAAGGAPAAARGGRTASTRGDRASRTKSGTGKPAKAAKASRSVKGDKPARSPLMLIVAAVVLLGAAVAGWFLFGPGGATETDAPVTGTENLETSGTDTNAAPSDASNAAGAAPLAPGTTAPGAGMTDATDSTAAAADAAGDSAPLALAPAPTAPAADENLSPLLDFELLPAPPGVSDENHAAWTGLARELFVESPSARARKTLTEQLEAINIVDLTPALVNALHGLDLSDAMDVNTATALLRYWRPRQGNKIKFAWNEDLSRMEPRDTSLRVRGVLNLHEYMLKRMIDPAAYETLKLEVAEEVAQRDAEQN